MRPAVRIYADPFEGLSAQLSELRGLIRIVPPLIEADRQRRWDEISARPSDGDDGDVIDVYEAEAGADEGWGHADFHHTIYVAAVVTAWAAFHDYLARQLKEQCLDYGLAAYPPLASLVEEEVRAWDRRFERLQDRYRDFAGIALKEVPGWDHVRHAHELRNALVHNQGQYTSRYLKTSLAFRPTEEDLPFVPAGDDGALIDRELIPLSHERVDSVIRQLLDVAAGVRDALQTPPPAGETVS